jgi:hypothetical protein
VGSVRVPLLLLVIILYRQQHYCCEVVTGGDGHDGGRKSSSGQSSLHTLPLFDIDGLGQHVEASEVLLSMRLGRTTRLVLNVAAWDTGHIVLLDDYAECDHDDGLVVLLSRRVVLVAVVNEILVGEILVQLLLSM